MLRKFKKANELAKTESDADILEKACPFYKQLDELFGEAKGRVIVATFASNVYRVREIISMAVKHKRKIVINIIRHKKFLSQNIIKFFTLLF